MKNADFFGDTEHVQLKHILIDTDIQEAMDIVVFGRLADHLFMRVQRPMRIINEDIANSAIYERIIKHHLGHSSI